jgi:2-amino-4-hydroxy-6-hydroxymethyldihydropteridine diphosphokinase
MTGPDRVDVYVSAGSNIEPEKNLRLACAELEKLSRSLSRSSVYRTQAIGFDGNDFLNMVISFSTRLSLDEIITELERIQAMSGRKPDASSFSSRTLDLDLLLYGEQVVDSPQISLPRADILKYAFVLGPMAELAPGLRHPRSGKTMGELWAKFDRSEQTIQRLAESPLT